MNFNHLLIFHKVAEKQHFTHATDFKLIWPLYLAYPKQKRLSKAAQAFLELLK